MGCEIQSIIREIAEPFIGAKGKYSRYILIILAIFEAYPIERSFSYLRCCSSAVPLAFFVPDLPVIAAYVSSSC